MIVSKRWEFSAGHRLMRHGGKCRHLHGHNYAVEVNVAGPVSIEDGMVVDFYDLSQIVAPLVDALDHAMILEEGDPVLGAYAEDGPCEGQRLVILPFAPTAENLAVFFGSEIGAQLPEGVRVDSIRVWETSKCFAEYRP